MQAELENNIDSHINDHGDLHDDVSLNSNLQGNKRAGGAKSTPAGKAINDRADTKVLEWTSFAPILIRQKYVSRLQAERSQNLK